MIDRLLAQKFIDKIASYTPHNVNIINEQGIIIAASKDVGRIGDFHEVAYNMMQKDSSVSNVTEDDGLLGVQPGVNLILFCKGRKIGVVGITGNPDDIYDIAVIIKSSLETMIEYESQYELIQERKNSKLHFMNTLLTAEEEDVLKELTSMAGALGYESDLVRIPVLITFPAKANTDMLMETIKSSPSHNSQDISHITPSGDILVFKSFAKDTQELFSQYRFLLEEYLKPFLQQARENNLSFHLYIGSFQNQLANYRYAFKHCNWMKQYFSEDTTQTRYFYDFINEYLTSQVPFIEIHKIYNIFSQSIPSDLQNTLLDTVDCLAHNNYNMNTTSQKLFIHKNTLVFRFNKIKNFFHLNPVQETSHRNFLSYLIYYLKNAR